MRIAACRSLVVVLCRSTLLAPGFASATTAATAAPTAVAAPPSAVAAPPTTVTDIVLGIVASENLQRATLARLEQASQWRDLAGQVVALEARVDGLPAGMAATGELIDAITRARQLRVLHGDASTVIDELGAVARQLEHDRRALESDARQWQERSSLLKGHPVPAPVLERAGSTEAKLQATNARVREYQNATLVALDRAVALLARIDDARALVAAQEARIRALRLQFEEASLWQVGAAPARFDVVAADVATAWRSLESYIAREGTMLAAWFVGAMALTGWLFMRGGRGTESARNA